MSKIIGVDDSKIANISGLGAGGGGEAHVLAQPSTGTIAYGGLALTSFPFDWATFFNDIPAYAYELSTIQFNRICQNGDHILATDSSGNLYHKTSLNNNSYTWGNTVYNEFQIVLTNVARFCLGSSSGSSYAVAIKTDGTLWVVGYNYYGQLGLGTSQTSQNSWAQVGSDTDWKDVVAGNRVIAALKGGSTDTYLYTAGSNQYGMTGQGTTSGYTTSFTRVKSSASTDWSENLNYSAGSFKIAANDAGCLVINSSGELFMFGKANPEFPVNEEASISINSDQTYVVQIGTDTDWQQIIIGGSDGAFRKNNGRLYLTGNTYGFIGFVAGSYSLVQAGTDSDWDAFDDSIEHGYGTGQTAARCFKKGGVIKIWGSPATGSWNSPTSNLSGSAITTLNSFPSGATVNAVSVNARGTSTTGIIISVS